MRQLIYLLPFFLFTACSHFLEADLNKSQITTDKVFSNDVTAIAAVTGIYYSIIASSSLNGAPNSMNALAGLSAGELYNYRQELDFKAFEQHDINPQNPNVERLWNYMYTIIYQANSVLEGVEASTALSHVTAQQLKGEAFFVRAFTYFYLVNLFGGVPLVVETDYHKTQLLPRRSLEDVYTLIESDLLSAQSLLTNGYVTEQRVRPNKATATALLARMYLYRKEYAKAASAASAIISDPAYHLTSKDSIDETFLIDSHETIWQIMPVSPNANTLEAQYFIITSTPSYHVLTDAMRLHFEEGDLRATHWINNIINSFDTFYFPYKYKQNFKDAKEPYGECSVVFRLAEIFLIRAEARAYLNEIMDAQSDLNAVRARAGLPDTDADDQQSLLLAIESERWSELFTEYGHRWLDLKRTGRAVAIIGNNITENELLYPLPASEFIKNPNLGVQNPN